MLQVNNNCSVASVCILILCAIYSNLRCVINLRMGTKFTQIKKESGVGMTGYYMFMTVLNNTKL